MKFLHLADLHLGKSLCERDLIEDQRFILKEIIDIAKENKVNAILIAGDLYDRGIPNESAVELLDWFLTEVAKQNIAVIAISGNHDSEERLNFGTRFFESHHVYITAKYDGTVPYAVLNDEYGPVKFWMLPYVRKSIIAQYHPDLDVSDYDAAVKSALSVADVNPEERNVILSHQFVKAGKSPELSGSESSRTAMAGTLEQINADTYQNFDYVALGHIHKPQEIGRNTCRYSGSPLKYSLSEIGQIKSVPLVTMKEKGNTDVQLIPLKPLHEMRHLKGHFEDLLNPKNVTDQDDYIYITLTDEDLIPNAMSRIQQVYPNTLRLDYDNSHTHAADSFDVNHVTRQESFHDIFLEFYRQMYGKDPSEKEISIIKEAAKKAGLDA